MKLKSEFVERMKELLGDDYENYEKSLGKRYINSIRCNTLKISPSELKARLEKKWKIKQPFKEFPEIMIIDQEIIPGEVGKALEHQLGYFYVQELSSMLPPLVLSPNENENVLDIAAAPGSKTTQMAAMMNNSGNLIANDVSFGRVKILAANLQRCGVSNVLVTQHDGSNLCSRLEKLKYSFDKILVDVPCTGEGNIRTNLKTCLMFNEKLIKKFSNRQKQIAGNAVKILKKGGVLVYSTCTHGPEENEEVIDYLLENFPLEIEEIKLPFKTRPGVKEWKGKEFHKDVEKCVRVYPQDENLEGFFIAKLRKTE
jgi:NOL1/NOP2/sun family putative RNA methylase